MDRAELKKHSCDLTLDPYSAHRYLVLSDNNKRVTCVDDRQPYASDPSRFDHFCQLLCSTGLTGRCYWEVEKRGRVTISVSYRGIRRKGNDRDCWFGGNRKSWSLSCSENRYSAWHNDIRTSISSTRVSDRVAVYLDHSAGTLSFYSVSSDTLTHLHTFNTTFSEPVYPGFGFKTDSSVFLCPLSEGAPSCGDKQSDC